MYTDCTIRWADIGDEYDVIIKTTDDVVDAEDDKIFFYGMSRAQLLAACKNKTLCENEWYVVAVRQTYDSL